MKIRVVAILSKYDWSEIRGIGSRFYIQYKDQDSSAFGAPDLKRRVRLRRMCVGHTGVDWATSITLDDMERILESLSDLRDEWERKLKLAASFEDSTSGGGGLVANPQTAGRFLREGTEEALDAIDKIRKIWESHRASLRDVVQLTV